MGSVCRNGGAANEVLDVQNALRLPPSSIPQPIPVDVDGDMKIDLLGISPTSFNLQLWQNVYNASVPDSPLFELCVSRPASP